MIRSIFSVALIIVALVGLFCPLFAADNKAGTVIKVRGQVTARQTADEQAATLRVWNAITVGQTIRTDQGAAAQLVLTDDSVIYLLAGTTLQMGQYSFSAGDNRRSAVIKVIAGSARFVVHKKRSNDSRFTVITDQASLGAWISDFFVTVAGKTTEVANVGPSLGIENVSPLAIGRVQLGTNQRSTVMDHEPPSQPATVTPEQRRKYLKDAEI